MYAVDTVEWRLDMQHTNGFTHVPGCNDEQSKVFMSTLQPLILDYFALVE